MKELEIEYKKQIELELPDLWSRIESGVDAYEASKNNDINKETTKVVEFANIDSKKEILEETVKNARRIAVMDNVENPTNMGAIVRSAAAIGMDAVIFARGCSDPLFRRSIRVSMGNIFIIPWTVYKSENYMDILKGLGFKTVAMALRSNTINIEDKEIKKEDKLAIILGNEGDGLPEETLDKCDYIVKIPMREGVDSLNVAAASAIAFWELV